MYELDASHSTLHSPHFTLHAPHFTLHTSHFSLHTSHVTLSTSHFTLHTSHCTLSTSHFSLHTSQSSHTTLQTPHFTLHTSHFSLHTSHVTLSTSHFTLHTPHFTLHTLHFTLLTSHFTHHSSDSTLHTSQSTFTYHKPSPCLTFPMDSGDDAIRVAKQLSLECQKVPRLPRDMHFHMSQHITCSHFPHRQCDNAIRDPRHENDPQTVHHPQTPYQENKNPSLRIRENDINLQPVRLWLTRHDKNTHNYIMYRYPSPWALGSFSALEPHWISPWRSTFREGHGMKFLPISCRPLEYHCNLQVRSIYWAV